MKAIFFAILATLGSFQLTKVVWNAVTTASIPTEVVIEVDTSQATDLAEFGSRVKVILEKWYTPIKTLLLSDEFQEVDRIRLYFDPNYNGVAYAIWEQNLIIASADYYRQNPNDVGSMVHELVHIIQQYPSGRVRGICPGWLAEGIADWVRYYVFEPSNKPNKPWTHQHYTSGYRIAAYFLGHLNSKWTRSDNHHNKSMISKLNKECRAGRYRKKLFRNLYGKTADQLWTEMIKGQTPFIVQVDTSQAPEMSRFAMRIKATLEHWYPYFAEKLSSPKFEPLDTIKVSFVRSIRGAMGYHSLNQKSIVGAADYFINNEDMGFWIKNMIHIIQQYRGTTCPDWVKSGIVDWAWYWHVETRQKPRKPWTGLNYKNGWWVSAYFMNFMNEKDQPQGKNVTYWLNRWCREDTFSDEIFQRFTGKTIDEQWQEMMKS